MDFRKAFERAKTTTFHGAKKLGQNLSDMARSFGYWVLENPAEAAAVIVPIGIAAIHSSQSLIVSHRINKQNKLSRCKIYDHSLGTYWLLDKPLSKKEMASFSNMKKSGKSTFEALDHLGKI